MRSLPRPPRTHVTPFPIALIDELMPTLKDTEWRVLCVVVRQTLGWQVDARTNRRKEADWLTQSQLKQRTGRASEALSKALDALVRNGWVEVCDEQGRLLSTPAQRRRYRGAAFFRLGQRTHGYLAFPERDSLVTSEPTYSHEDTYSQSEVRLPQSEFRKANTTKETYTKIIPYGREDRATVIHRQPVDNPLLQEMNKKRKIKTESQHQASPNVKRVLHTYITLFRQQTVNGESPVISWGKDGKIVKQLLELYSYVRLVELLHQFFASKDIWIRQSGYSIGAFRAAINKLIVQEKTSPGFQGRVHTYSWGNRNGQWIKV